MFNNFDEDVCSFHFASRDNMHTVIKIYHDASTIETLIEKKPKNSFISNQ